MAIFDGNNYTQLTFLNVTELLRVNGEIVNSGGGDVVGPPTSGVGAVPTWANTMGTELNSTGLHASSTGDISWQTEMATYGIDWDDVVTERYTTAEDTLRLDLVFPGTYIARSWNMADGITSSTQQGSLTLTNTGRASIASTSYDGTGTVEQDCIIELGANEADPISVADPQNLIGMRYAANYASANASAERWIPDKKYVDDAIAAGVNPPMLIIGVTDPANAGDVEISNAQIAIGGSTYIIKDESGDANSNDKITITAEGGQTIDDETEMEIMTGYGVVRLYSDDTNLFSW